MKTLLAGVFFVCLLSGQEKKSFWLIRIEPTREHFIPTMTAEEKKIMSDHFEYLKGKLKEGTLVMAGPAVDEVRPMGIIIVEVATKEEAEAIGRGDPSIRAGLQSMKVFPFHMSLAREKLAPASH